MGSQKRIAKVALPLFASAIPPANNTQELAELTESPPEGIAVQLPDESNLFEWRVFMDGPEGSPYQVRRFFTTSPASQCWTKD